MAIDNAPKAPVILDPVENIREAAAKLEAQINGPNTTAVLMLDQVATIKAAVDAIDAFDATMMADAQDPLERFLDRVRSEAELRRRGTCADRVALATLIVAVGKLADAVTGLQRVEVRNAAIDVAVMAARLALDGDASMEEFKADPSSVPVEVPSRKVPMADDPWVNAHAANVRTLAARSVRTAAWPPAFVDDMAEAPPDKVPMTDPGVATLAARARALLESETPSADFETTSETIATGQLPR